MSGTAHYKFEVHVELPDGGGQEWHLLNELARTIMELPRSKQANLRIDKPVKVEDGAGD
jgi:hypothetical protein